ncbi:hypothetical protein GpartN1_g7.t1 [Galdieria partita]|uniref:FAD-binding PCMH-type domain-containing protein n=1 Tax=Galdieria partita TaxID=83374 RepID=A0A9C7UMF7_9RHOD|nr:hypothetical protein GpartN1_g7.t1 [Galdieria partita]
MLKTISTESKSLGDTRVAMVLCYINGISHQVQKPEKLLIDYLREDCSLTGTKLGCGEGGCGACTVWIWTVDPVSMQPICYTVNACLVNLAMVDSCYIMTIEGIGNRKKGLHPIQKLLTQYGGSQCGFCTPGILMSMYGLGQKCKASKTVLDIEQVESHFDGNLCRCTGYRSIFDAFKEYVQVANQSGTEEQPPQDLLQNLLNVFGTRRRTLRIFTSNAEYLHSMTDSSSLSSYLHFSPSSNINIDHIFIRPTSLEQVMHYKRVYPLAKFIVGNSEVGIDVKMKHRQWKQFILLNDVPELLHLNMCSDGCHIGAAVSLDKILEHIEQLKRSEHRFRAFYALGKQLKRFGGVQIRNVASLGGNIVTASPISDIQPLLVAMNATFQWISCNDGIYKKAIASDFFVGYRQTLLHEDDLLVDIWIPFTNESEYVFAYKVSRRQEDDIAIVSAAMRFVLRSACYPDTISFRSTLNKDILEDVSIVYGGMAERIKRAEQTEAALRGSPLDPRLLMPICFDTLDRDFVLNADSPGGMVAFRKTIACSLLLRSFYRLEHTLQIMASHSIHLPKEEDERDELDPSFSCRAIQTIPQHLKSNSGFLGSSSPHPAPFLQCSGEAQYVDDIPNASMDTLYGAFILSSEPHANVLSIDCSQVYDTLPGMTRIFFSQDVPGTNSFSIVHGVCDEQVFCSGHVTAVGQVIGFVVADTREHAKMAARLVKIEYERLPAILTIEDARAQESFEPCCGRMNLSSVLSPHWIEDGNVDEVMNRTDLLKVSGKMKIGAQEHFYLETHGCLAIPGENDELVLFVSTQSPAKTQMAVSKVLGLESHKVVCKTKRIGGGFGGKETRNIFISCAVAVAAHLLKKPVRISLDREEDMCMTGHRHPFLGEYRVAFDKLGKILAVETLLFANIGNTLDLSMAVLDRALFHSENVYFIPNVRFIGRLCWTHIISNTAFRGFGGPQAMAIAETWIHHVAHQLKMDPESVRSINMYRSEGFVPNTPYGMPLIGWTGWQCWQSVLESSDFWNRKQQITEYNAQHRYRKRGIAAVPTKFGISFTNKTYNQAGVLVLIYLDGSVLVSHGGVEMGQGLYAKIVQIVASEFDIPLHKVYISETSTDKVPNASPTAASSSTDLYGMAAIDACRQLLDRLKTVDKDFCLSWEARIQKAYHERISLSATGFYCTPEIDSVDLSQNQKGNPFYYFTVGAAVSEIELDTLTGEHHILRTDIMMDIGRPLHPVIDIGQVEGGFVQGLGLFTLEEVILGDEDHSWLPRGHLFTKGPSTYKLPGFHDIPRDFRVSFLSNAVNHRPIIHGSKAVGEPPLFLAFSVFEALRNAIESARSDLSSDACELFCALDSPLTIERIRMACYDEIVSHVLHESKAVKDEK